MSTASASSKLVCAECGGSRSRSDPGSFCSTVCATRYKGRKALNQVESQSQFCNTCYGQVRDVEPIPERVHPDGDGFQYRTERSTIGVDDFADDPYTRQEGTRWSCTCGAVDPNRTTAELQNVDLGAVIANLYRALVWCYRREAIDGPPSWERYADALRERPRDAAFACGRSVYGDG